MTWQRFAFYLSLFILMCFPVLAQFIDLTKPLEVTIYDEETFARVNGLPWPPDARPSSEVPTTPNTVGRSDLDRRLPSAPAIEPDVIERKWPRDISDQYTEFIRGIPVIQNPESCGQAGLQINVRVKNIKTSKGFIVADLHDHIVEDFLEPEKVVLRIRQSAQKGVTEFCIPLRQPGDYAVAVYHDKNDNRKFDKGFMRIPTERFGMSQNPKFGFSAPDHEQAVFSVSEDGASIVIRLVKSSDILNGQ